MINHIIDKENERFLIKSSRALALKRLKASSWKNDNSAERAFYMVQRIRAAKFKQKWGEPL